MGIVFVMFAELWVTFFQTCAELWVKIFEAKWHVPVQN